MQGRLSPFDSIDVHVIDASRPCHTTNQYVLVKALSIITTTYQLLLEYSPWLSEITVGTIKFVLELQVELIL